MDSDDIMWGIVAADEAKIKNKEYLRIEFAKAALTGLTSNPAVVHETNGWPKDISDFAFDFADAMIERLNKY